MIVGFLALRFPGKTYVLCVLDISLCDRRLIVRSGESQEILNLY
jgi:hypothetical protein